MQAHRPLPRGLGPARPAGRLASSALRPVHAAAAAPEARKADPAAALCSCSTSEPDSAAALGSGRLAAAATRSKWAGLTKALKSLVGPRRLHQMGESSGAGAQVLAMSVAPALALAELQSNRVLIGAFLSWFVAQFLKIFTKRFKKGVWDLGAFLEPGGMPSSHSSLCAGVTTGIAMQLGLSSPLFAAAMCFSVIVMYDAAGVRRHAGKQAEVLNQVIIELMEDHPEVREVRLKEVLGHTPRQVVCGAITGVVVSLFYWINC